MFLYLPHIISRVLVVGLPDVRRHSPGNSLAAPNQQFQLNFEFLFTLPKEMQPDLTDISSSPFTHTHRHCNAYCLPHSFQTLGGTTSLSFLAHLHHPAAAAANDLCVGICLFSGVSSGIVGCCLASGFTLHQLFPTKLLLLLRPVIKARMSSSGSKY